MILTLKDWAKYPEAIVDTTTKNVTFIRVSLLFKKMGIKNHAFPLALLDPTLQGVDPRDPNLTEQQKIAIAIECSRNPWYFLREIIRIPGSGSALGSEFLANRANIAYAWCYFKHITALNIQPRQTGKSINNDAISIWLLCFGGRNVTITLFTKSHGLRVINIERLKEMFDLLPSYLNPRNKKDTNNQEEISVNAYGNVYKTLIGQTTTQAAMNVGRGNTSENLIGDELGHIPNVEISLPALLPATMAARENAAKTGAYYCNMYTTTPGYLSTKSGIYAKGIYDDCAKWTEKYYDYDNDEELYKAIANNSRANKVQVLLEFNHRQLGKTDDWLRARIRESQAVSKDVIEAEYLNKWPSGSSKSPFSRDILERFKNSETTPKYEEVYDNGYMTQWYITEDVLNTTFRSRSIILGLDTSEMIDRDASTLIFVDTSTGEVIGSGVYNKQNVAEFANFIANILIKYKNITLVPEHKSTFSSIIDYLFLFLPRRGIDPFRRIFNRVVNEKHENEEYQKVYDMGIYRDASYYTKYKAMFGFRTAGAGEFSRNMLYGPTLQQSCKYLAHLVHDKRLISELMALVVKNGRIDHTASGNDDTVISWCLATWFLYNARNKASYGIDETKVLDVVKIDSGSKNPDVKLKELRQSELQNQIMEYAKLLQQEENEILKRRYANLIRMLYQDLDVEYSNILSFDELMKQLKLEKSIGRNVV